VFAFERRWERWRPVPKDRWRENAAPADGGGLLLDLGPHLVDAAVQLLGPVTHVYAELAARTTRAEDDVLLLATHAGGARSRLQAGSLVGAPGPRTRVLGRRGAYVATGFEGDHGAFAGFEDVPGHTGWLVAGDERTPVPTAPGEPTDFYRAVAAALAGGGQQEMPVLPEQAVHTTAVLDAARASAQRLAVVPVEDPAG
jgi:predicted dehydrogenase